MTCIPYLQLNTLCKSALCKEISSTVEEVGHRCTQPRMDLLKLLCCEARVCGSVKLGQAAAEVRRTGAET